MAVAYDASSESHTGTTGSASEASFSWTHVPSGTPKGVTVFVCTIGVTDLVTSITYGGVAVTEIPGAVATDTSTEVGRVRVYHLGSGIPTGNQTVEVTRTNNATVMYAVCITSTASTDTAAANPILLQGSGTAAYTEQSVDDGSPGSNSVRYAGGYWGGNDPIPAGANSTSIQSIDFGSFTFNVAYETTAGQGARSIGFDSSGGTDDRAAVHIVVRETGTVSYPTRIASGTDTDDDETTSTGSVSFTSGRLYILSVDSKSEVTADPPQPTAAGATFTFSAINTVVYDNSSSSRRRLTVLYLIAGSTASDTITITHSGQTQVTKQWTIDEIATGFATSGTIVQSAVNSSPSSSVANLAATLSAFSSADNATFIAFASGNGTDVYTAGGGLTPVNFIQDTAENNLSTLTAFCSDNDTGPDINISPSQAEVGVVAFEIKADGAPPSVTLVRAVFMTTNTGFWGA